jgi:acyl carrier protein
MDERLGSEIREVLSAVLGRPIASGDDVARVDNPDWDSLKHIEVVFALEGALGVRFDADEIGYLSGVDAIAAAVERHRAA